MLYQFCGVFRDIVVCAKWVEATLRPHSFSFISAEAPCELMGNEWQTKGFRWSLWLNAQYHLLQKKQPKYPPPICMREEPWLEPCLRVFSHIFFCFFFLLEREKHPEKIRSICKLMVNETRDGWRRSEREGYGFCLIPWANPPSRPSGGGDEEGWVGLIVGLGVIWAVCMVVWADIAFRDRIAAKDVRGV